MRTQHPIRIAQPQARSGNFLARVCIVIFTTIDITIAINRGILVGTCLVCDRQRLLFLVLEFIHRKKGNPTADGVDPWIWVGFGRPSIVVGIVAIVVIVVVIVIVHAVAVAVAIAGTAGFVLVAGIIGIDIGIGIDVVVVFIINSDGIIACNGKPTVHEWVRGRRCLVSGG